METILFLTYTQSDGTLPKNALEALSAALELHDQLDGSAFKVGLIGGETAAAANSIAGCKAAAFLSVTGPEFAPSRYGTDAAAAAALVKNSAATIVIAPATSRFNRALPGAAYRSRGRITTHVTGLETADDTIQVQRWYYRQRMLASLSRPQRPWFLLIDSGVYPAWNGSAGSAAREEVPVEVTDQSSRTEVVGIESKEVVA